MSGAKIIDGKIYLTEDVLRFESSQTSIFTGVTVNPTVVPVDGRPGDMIITTAGKHYIKSDSGASTSWGEVPDVSMIGGGTGNLKADGSVPMTGSLLPATGALDLGQNGLGWNNIFATNIKATGLTQALGGLSLNGASISNASNISLLNGGAVTINPAALTTAHTLTLPAAQGAANTLLANNGAGVLSWVAPSGGGSLNVLQATSNVTTIGTSNVWHSLIGNSLALPVGVWELHCTLLVSGSGPFTRVLFGYSADPGDDTTVNPAALTGKLTPSSSIAQYSFEGSTPSLNNDMTVVIVNGGQTLYANPKITTATPATTTVQTFFWARKLY